MNLGIVGLGCMGRAIAYRALQGGCKVFGFDQDKDAVSNAKKIGVEVVASVQELAQQVRLFWIMVPAGSAVDLVLDQLLPGLQRGDIIIDGGNSNFKDSVRRYEQLQKKEILFFDCGTSGGLAGKKLGFSLMVGGDKEAYKKIIPLLELIAAKDGYGYVGKSGAGHYVKMIHNGIEYGLLQAYADGFRLLKEGRYEDLDLEYISRIWMHGSIIRSYMLELSREIFKADQDLIDIIGEVEESGTGQWAFEEAEELGIPVPSLEIALKVRQWSRETGGNYATKLIALLRNKFGGHKVEKL